MKFLHRTKKGPLTLSIDNDVGLIGWYVDMAFVVHPDYRGYTGSAMKFCKLERLHNAEVQ